MCPVGQSVIVVTSRASAIWSTMVRPSPEPNETV